MTRVRIAILLIIPIALIGILTTRKDNPSHPTIGNEFFLPATFEAGDQGAPRIKENRHIVAAIVPHHLIAGTPLSKIFKLLQSKGYRRVFIIGPNHYDVGHADILTAMVDVETPFGVQQSETWLHYPAVDVNLMQHEHSIMGMMPYMKYYMHATFQPFILKAKTPEAELERLADLLLEEFDKKTVVLFSVDFSHYLPKSVADANDAVTERAPLAMDEDAVYAMNNDFIDSPASLALMFKICKRAGAPFTILDHTNSADLLGQKNLLSTTSHFSGYCAR